MNPVTNPFAPGAGTRPPELAGRDELLADAGVTLQRIKLCKPAKSFLMVGLRGVGKTVLLDTIRDDAEGYGIHTLRVEAPEDRSLPAILAPQLRKALLRLSRNEQAKEMAQKGLRALSGFAKALKVTYADIDVGLDFEPEPGLADAGNLEDDLQDLLSLTGVAAKSADTAIALFVDELQYVPQEQLAALITALHRVAQQSLPVVLFGAGLPQLRGQMGRAKSYAERLFQFPDIGPLSDEATKRALVVPTQEQGVDIELAALDSLVQYTKGYPYFVQEWGKHTWDAASKSPITMDDVRNASITTVAELDESFFRVRFDRLTPGEKEYLRAMAELGPGCHRSGDIAEVLGKNVTATGPTKSQLIEKGMIWSPQHGDTAFTVPLFDEFMKRIMPGGIAKN